MKLNFTAISHQKILTDEEKKEIDLIKLLDRISKLETHIVNLCQFFQYIPQLFDMLQKPLKIDQSGLLATLNQCNESMIVFKRQAESLNITQTYGEIKFIGKKLHEIEALLIQMKEDGIKKNVQLDISCNGYELVKKKAENSSKENPEELLEYTLSTLTDRESKVLKRRFGLLGFEKMTLKKIGEEFNVSGERIREIEQKGLKKLRHPSRRQYVSQLTHKALRQAILGE